MKREFTANILFLIGINLLIKPFYALAIDTSVQNIVGPEQYGLFLAIFNFVYIQQIFADLGVQNYNNRNISQNPDQLVNLLPKVLGSKIIFTLLFFGLTMITSWIFGYLKYFNEILVWVILSQATLSFLLYLRSNVSGKGRYFSDSVFSVLDKLLLIILLSYIIWVNPSLVKIDITFFAQAQFVSLLITVLFVLFFTQKRLGVLKVRWDFVFMKSLLKDTLPYASLVILMAGYSRMDGIMLEQMIDDNALEAGKYATSFRLYDTFNNFAFLFAVLLLPMFSKMIKKKEPLADLVSWAFKLLSFGSLFAIVMIYFKGEEIMRFFYVNVEAGFPMTLFLLMLAGLALSLNYIYGTLLTANGSIRVLNIIALGGFVLNILVNFFLIPSNGGEGAAFATMLTQFTVLICQIIYCYKNFDLALSFINFTKIVASILMVCAVFYIFDEVWKINLWLGICIAGLVGLSTAILLKLIRTSDLKMEWRK